MCFSPSVRGQSELSEGVEFSGYVEAYYGYNFRQPNSQEQPDFLYNFRNGNEFNINLGLLQLSKETEDYRVNLGLMAGNYVQYNLAAEPEALQHIYEASVGIALNKSKNLWIDAGIFSSHIGFESAIGIDNPTLSRSLLAENSPYYLAGVKVTYEPSEKLTLTGLITNGWQRMQRVEGNTLPSFGTQVALKTGEESTLNWSTFIGTDDPDSTRRMRYFNNVYWQGNVSEKLGLTLGFDIGLQQDAKGSSDYDKWFSPIMIARYQLSDKWSVATRVEYYSDEDQVIVTTPTNEEFNTFGYSLNLDLQPKENIRWRIEARGFNASEQVFEKASGFAASTFMLLTSLGVKF